MAELLEEQRETWGTRGGFVLAAIGSAVGLGNLWGFPYKLYDHGGGAFLIPYVIAMFCIGIPMLILEFSLGHFTQRAAPNAFSRCNRKLEFVGWWGILLGFVIITYYPVILGYCFSFMFYSIESIVTGRSLPWAGDGMQGVENAKNFFSNYLTEGPAWFGIQLNVLTPVIIAWIAMYLCIFKGVKFVGKIVWLTVPLPFLMLVVLAVRGLTLPGAMKGLVYYLDPVWSELAKPATWRFAFGQVFFSLSLAFGVMVTYASFLHRKSDINNNAAIIGLADFGTSFVGGIAIFATLGGMAFATQQAGHAVGVENVVDGGPGLAFVAFPYAIAQLPGAAWWSLIFFFTLVTLGIDSAFSITESVLAGFVDKTGWKRSIVLPVMSLVGLLLGLIYVTSGGIDWLGTIDGFINGTWGIAFLGFLECVVLGWFYRIEKLRAHANERSDWKIGTWFNHAIRIFIPIALGTLVIWNLFDDFTKEGGFFRSPEGTWLIHNCVGISVMAVVPVIAIILSLIKSPIPAGDTHGLQSELQYPPSRSGRMVGAIAFVLALASAAIIAIVLLGRNDTSLIRQPFLYITFALAALALVIANNILRKLDTSAILPSTFARWAGIIALLDISTCIAMVLIHLAENAGHIEPPPRDTDSLSIVSYIILAVVAFLIIGGLAWCFYRAITVSANSPQSDTND